LEDGKGKNNDMSRRVWKVVKNKADKSRIAKSKKERIERRKGKEREEKKAQKTDRRRRNGNSESSSSSSSRRRRRRLEQWRKWFLESSISI